jgi:hypothetical protein
MAAVKKTKVKAASTRTPKAEKKTPKVVAPKYTTFEQTGIILFTLLSISFLFFILAKYMQ